MHSATEWLFSRADRSTHLDFSKISMLSTVGRAARHLVEKLVVYSENEKIGISPPNILSISNIFSILLPDKKLVSSIDSQLIFLSILKDCDLSLFGFLFPRLDKEATNLKLFEKSCFLSRTYQEFTKNGDSVSNSIESLLQSGLIPNEDRWLELNKIFSLYREKLTQLGLLDTQSALTLLETTGAKSDSQLILLGCHDLAPIVKRCLKAGFKNIVSLIFAAAEEKAGFDEIGCIKAQYWKERNSIFDSKKIRICADSKAQAYDLFSELSSIPSETSASKITIGALEPGMDRLIESMANQQDLEIHIPNKSSLHSTEAALLITGGLKYTISRKFADLSALLSFEALCSKLPLRSDTQNVINKYRENHLQPQVIDTLPSASPEVLDSIKQIDLLFKKLMREKALIADWIESVASVLVDIYGEILPPDASSLLEVLTTLRGNYSELELEPEVFLELVSSVFAESGFSEKAAENEDSANPDCIDLVGWLELALDDASYTFITSFNQGFVPLPANHNPFLPDKARKLLVLEDDDYRLARDSYVLETFLHSKQNLIFFSAKHSLESSPLLPSKLALRGKSEKMAQTIVDFFSVKTSIAGSSSADSVSSFKSKYAEMLVPKKKVFPVPISLSVTALSDYLRCPYLYYLKHVLKLKTAAPDSRELTALQFGSLLHEIIADFANSHVASETSSKTIETYLLSQLQVRFNLLFGKSPFAEVLVQYHQLASRLINFAAWQSSWTISGWKVFQVEAEFAKPGFNIMTDSGPALLKGRIDRVDFNSKTSEYAILDFKSGDKSATSNVAFSKTKGWQDLQLATYSFYASEILGIKNPRLAIVPLSASSEELSVSWANWDDEMLISAKESLRSTLNAIIEQKFWPPKITSEKAFDLSYIYRACL